MASRVRPDDRAFLLLWGAQAVSSLGASAASFALTLQVYAETGSALALSALTVVSTVASIYLAPLTGWAADRLGHRRAALVSNLMLALASGGMAVVSALGPGHLLAVVYPLTLVSALAASTLALTLTASVRRMRREADLTRINGVTSLLQDGPTLLAPVLGAALSAVVAPAAVFVVDGATSLGCVAALLAVRWDAPPDRRVANPFRGARDGIAWILRHPGLGRLQAGFAALNLANGIAASATTAYVLLLGAGGLGSGASLAAFSVAGSVGLLAGAGFVAARGDRIPRLVAIAGSAVVLGLVGRVALGASALLAVWILAAVVRNVALQVQGAPLTAVWQERVPPGRQGAVLGAKKLLGQGFYPPAVLLGGALTVALHPLGQETALRVVIIAGGLGEALVGVAMLRSRGIRALLAPAAAGRTAA
ncbi:MFS transporter [Clavibacter michiganensis]|uniref:MFS transporter permease n=3 Tax=Clavibacter michiganensis subsp. insidiosus TaxID=33014 RepID=A0A0D5CFL9_9MICO|nr:MFS transporter [Clavibacter michiganensis]AJW78090.1 MFS transporter permease [Clavibacter michiganensis subsp. insidiosus]AWF99519.1 MFS transporter [Clavibacter michiganensis subsp. insidiosus]AWG00361.1 MFS transporter [Clavibacter michiganensis subsp. insidiosus]OQJ61006.1 MFS transporter [Clavibacter michiganensis subsp. insidiosus]RII87345.1 MFS transporter [Clavibacter michiganensis subsp. insidiosus]